jgi:hypothetical protein
MGTVKIWTIVAAFLIGLAFMAPQGFADDAKFPGFLGDYTGFMPGPKDGVKLRWIKPGVDWKKYTKIMVDSTVFFFADNAKYKGIEPNELKEISDGFNEEIVKALKDAYPIVADPGPDVMRIRFAITDLEPGHPGRSAVTSVVPVGIALSLVRRGFTGKWTGAGGASMEMEALDSTTNERIAAAIDDHPGGKTSSFTKWGSVKEAGEFWAKRLRTALDEARGIPAKQ